MPIPKGMLFFIDNRLAAIHFETRCVVFEEYRRLRCRNFQSRNEIVTTVIETPKRLVQIGRKLFYHPISIVKDASVDETDGS